MARDIKSLLSKKGWTGEEVGKALIANLVNDAEQGSTPHAPLFAQADLEKMENGLKEVTERIVYGIYRDIYSAILDFFNRGQGLQQQFYNGYYRYLMYLNQCMDADHALKNMENYPLIMTQEQYTRIKEAMCAEKRSAKVSYKNIVFDMLGYYMGQYGEPAEIPAKIATAIKATKSQPVTNKRILENYNEDMGEGYYTLKDGRRSDQMTTEEWQKALEAEFLDTHQLTINGEPASAEETAQKYNAQRLITGYQLFFKGIEAIKEAYKRAGVPFNENATEEELQNALEDIIDGIGRAEHTTNLMLTLQGGVAYSTSKWHTPENPPADLTKYDILESLLERYNGANTNRLLSGEFVAEISEREQYNEFIADYPALYKALKGEIEARIPQAKGLSLKPHEESLLSYGELADLKIEAYKHFIESYSKRGRIMRRGIAIIQNPSEYLLTDSGDYEERENPYRPLISLDSLSENIDKIEEIQAYIKVLALPALRYLYAYNALINIIARVYTIEGEEALKFNVAGFENQIEALNNLLFIFYSNVYGEREEKHRKRALIREIFQPVDLEELKPARADITAVEAQIAELGLSNKARKEFKNFDTFINKLMGEGASL